MSWSINLSGKRRVVLAELEGALRQLSVAREQLLNNIANEDVSVSGDGTAYANGTGEVFYGSSNSVRGIEPPPLQPNPREEAKAVEQPEAAQKPTASEAQTEYEAGHLGGASPVADATGDPQPEAA